MVIKGMDELSDYIDRAGCFYGKHFCDKLEGYPNASENICPYKPKLLHLANAKITDLALLICFM